MDEYHDWLRLAHAPLRLELLHKLLQQFGHPSQVLAAASAELTSLGLTQAQQAKLSHASKTHWDEDLQWLEASPQHTLLTYADPDYPPLLRQISQPPLVLYLKGNKNLLSLPQVAMVGTRKPTYAGRETAFAMAKQLAEQGLVITSGLAHGIDRASHEGALAAGGGTIAIVGTGLDVSYPRANSGLAAQIAEQGLLVSEFALGTGPRKLNFPRRNRLISGLSLGVLVVEAGLPSGSLVTCKYALEQGKEVWAVPGSIHNTQAKGCHWLLKQGAQLVEEASEVMESCPAEIFLANQDLVQGTQYSQGKSQMAKEYYQLLGCFDDNTTQVDRLISRSGLTTEQVSSMLLVLELQGYVVAQPGGYQLTTAAGRT